MDWIIDQNTKKENRQNSLMHSMGFFWKPQDATSYNYLLLLTQWLYSWWVGDFSILKMYMSWCLSCLLLKISWSRSNFPRLLQHNLESMYTNHQCDSGNNNSKSKHEFRNIIKNIFNLTGANVSKASTKRWSYVGPILVRSLRRCPNSKQALVQRAVFAGKTLTSSWWVICK